MLKKLNDAYLNITGMLVELYSEIINYFWIMSFVIIGIALFLGGSFVVLNIYKEEFFREIIIFVAVILSLVSIFVLLMIIIFNIYRKYYTKYVKPICTFKKLHNSLSFEMYKINMMLILFNGDESKVKAVLQNYDDMISKIKNEYLDHLFNIKNLINNFIDDSRNKRFIFEYDNSKLYSLLTEYSYNVDTIKQIVDNS